MSPIKGEQNIYGISPDGTVGDGGGDIVARQAVFVDS